MGNDHYYYNYRLIIMTANELEYKGKQLPSKTNWLVLTKLCKKYNYTLQNFTDCLTNPEHFTYLFHESLKEGHKLAEQKFEILEADLDYILSDNYGDFVEQFNLDCITMVTPKRKLAEIEAAKKKI